MEQYEHQTGQNNSYSLSVFYGTIHDQFPENIFLKDRRADHHIEKCNDHIGSGGIGHQCIVHCGAF